MWVLCSTGTVLISTNAFRDNHILNRMLEELGKPGLLPFFALTTTIQLNNLTKGAKFLLSNVNFFLNWTLFELNAYYVLWKIYAPL